MGESDNQGPTNATVEERLARVEAKLDRLISSEEGHPEWVVPVGFRPEVKEQLERLASDREVDVCAVIRDAVKHYLRNQGMGDDLYQPDSEDGDAAE